MRQSEGSWEDSVKHYGTRAVYNAIEQALPRPNVSSKFPKLSYDAVVKDMRKELHGHFKEFHDKAQDRFDEMFFNKTVPRRRTRIAATRIQNNVSLIRKVRTINDIDNFLAYEDQKRKNKNFQAPIRV